MGARVVRSVRSARRLRVLAGLVTGYAVLVGLGGVALGVGLATYRRIYVGPLQADGTPGPESTTFPYVWEGVGVAVGAVVLATLLLLLAELARLRAHVVLDAAAAGRAARPAIEDETERLGQIDAEHASPRPVSPNGRRVLVLSDKQKDQLARIPPPQLDEGWYPDPLDAGSLRRWNGAQWTGEQQAIVLPPR